ncbi:uroporphyrinogen-III synthase, partial [Microbacterium sp.]|uniref:uroporphyrinogen-III synthase n=1 Tax=Microbacterium sp. TaxID=51671 RepID=UPI003C7954D2
LGADVAFVPVGQSSARAMVAQWSAGRSPASTGRCLVVRSDLAAAVVSDELEMQGYAVDVCIGYRTVGVDLPPEVADDLRDGRIDIVLLTSLSVARELRRQLFRGAAAPGGEKTCLGDASLPGRPGILPASVLVASIGPGTTRDAESLGFTVGHTAHTQSVDALLAELDARPRLPEEVAP